MQSQHRGNADVSFTAKPKGTKMKLLCAGILFLLSALLLLDWSFVRYRLLDESLAPQYWGGQKVVTLRTAYWLQPPQRNDLIIYSPARNEYRAAKILAVPGDRLTILHGKVVLNGVLAPEGPDFGDLSLPQISIPKGFVCLLPPPGSPLKFQLTAINAIQGKVLGNWQVLMI